MGLPCGSLSAYMKGKVRKSLNQVAHFEVAVAAEAQRSGQLPCFCHISCHILDMRVLNTEVVLYNQIVRAHVSSVP